MPTISIELVPRSATALEEECLAIKARFPDLQVANIPDILRMPIRSWEACRIAKRYFQRVIPHLRAIDFCLSDVGKIEEAIAGFDEVLVVSGDPPRDFSRRTYPTTSVDLIAFIKRRFPHMRVYAGLDPYRSGPRAELRYLKRKREAGADAFFTQPFFCLHLLEAYRSMLSGDEVFWGISPVLSEKSRGYWETTNQAIFAEDYQHTMEFNQSFARSFLDRLSGDRTHVYFMPVRTDTVTYLEGILETGLHKAGG
ncbi:MAG: methylenetetrahydrofolate reductase [Verrucomicrobiaceae bacterium]|nr:methylenetetrahydrofolate reductase [Verrucomicrobiaceae bacterium]